MIAPTFQGGSWAPWRLVKRTVFPAHPTGANNYRNAMLPLPDGRVFSVKMVPEVTQTYFYNPQTTEWSTGLTWGANGTTTGPGTTWPEHGPLWLSSPSVVSSLDIGDVPAAIQYSLQTGAATYKTITPTDLPGVIDTCTLVGLEDGTALLFGMCEGATVFPHMLHLNVNSGTSVVVTARTASPVTCYRSYTCPLKDGRVFIAGGWDSTRSAPIATARIYDPVKNTYTAIAPLPVAQAGGAAVQLPSGDVLIQGGAQTSPLVGTYYLYNMATNTWSVGLGEGPANTGNELFLGPQGQVMLYHKTTGALSTFDPASRQFASYWRV